MVLHTELLLAPECCDKMSCDDTGRRPVLRGRHFWVWEGQTRLFHWQASDPRPGIPSYTPMKGYGINDYLSDFSTGLKVSLMLGVTRFTNAQVRHDPIF